MTLEQDTKLQSKATLVRKRKSLVSSAHVEKAEQPSMETKVRSVAESLNSKRKASRNIYPQTSVRMRRSVDIALGEREVELQVPAIHIPWPRWRILSILLLIFSIAMMTMAAYSDNFEVESVQISGHKRIQPADIKNTLRVERQNIFMVDPLDLEQKLRNAFPELKAVSARVELPDKVFIAIEERVPAMLWTYNEMSFWTDLDGKIFAARGEDGSLVRIEAQDAPPLIPQEFFMDGNEAEKANPGITGHIEENSDEEIDYHMIIDPTVNNAIRKLSSMMPAGTVLAYNNKNGVGWNDPNGWTTYVGTDLSNLDQKLVVYRSIVEYLQQSHYKPSMIDVEFVHAPFYRLEQ